ncbi:DUF4416 family protein [Desulfohalobiaceae bacterium Ax17]|uniref:DUF4416 family protein n=1 Tax=Desulfovulcanus ferrireducens TaxID=2831190 RepID=UPI00207BBE46|nr:DUF4416 family protein [Desulfovulcanus ferrireducens]MBT8763578.1 DUF4416 family protein [Desulfovulcanus ferrireducens]
MSTPQIPKPGKLILSILSAKWELFWPGLLSTLEKKMGRVDYQSELIPFTETRYYDEELGTPIFRRILSFSPLVPLDILPEIKLWTNSIENEYAQTTNSTPGNKRIFNLDPGILTHERLVLATGKNFTHRIYLRDGIWADLTLIFTKGDFQNLPWTFPDYASEKVKIHLRKIREQYHKECIKNG